jgi:hypothetical protein
MHYVSWRSHQKQQDKFDVTCPSALFNDTALGPPEQEEVSVDVLCPERIGIHYETRQSHKMQNTSSV